MLDKLLDLVCLTRALSLATGTLRPLSTFSIPSYCFLSLEQVEAVKRGEPIVDIAECTPWQADEPALAPVTIDIDAAPRPNVTFPHLVSESPNDGDHAA